MSVTIRPVGADGRPFGGREVKRPCTTCASGCCQPGWCVDGIESEWISDAPEHNFANDNARALLANVGIDPGEYLSGSLEPTELPSLIEVCEAALADNAQALMIRAPMLRAESNDVGTRGARVIVCESNDESAKRRIASLLEVLRFAHEYHTGVSWD